LLWLWLWLVFALARLCEEGEACSDEAIQDVDFNTLTSWIASSEQASPSSQRRARAKTSQSQSKDEPKPNILEALLKDLSEIKMRFLFIGVNELD
jgi:hypothetical protein